MRRVTDAGLRISALSAVLQYVVDVDVDESFGRARKPAAFSAASRGRVAAWPRGRVGAPLAANTHTLIGF